MNIGGNDFGDAKDLKMLTVSSITQLDLYDCKLNQASVSSLLDSTSQLSFLNISDNDIATDSIVAQISDMLSVNGKLQALCLADTGLTDEHVRKLVTGFETNTPMTLLDLGLNTWLTSHSLTEVIAQTRIKHLSLYNCDIGADGWQAVASALVYNPHIVTVLVGDETDLARFLQTMRGYPPDGPLRHLLVWGDRAALAQEACALQQALPTHTTLSFVNRLSPFLVLSDVWCSHIPMDMRTWFTAAYVHAK